MRFDCGPTPAERAKAEQLAWEIELDHLQRWHYHFVWWPTRMNGTRSCRWLETVWRKGKLQHDGYGNDYWTFEYKAI